MKTKNETQSAEKTKLSLKFRIVDYLFLAMIILPFICGMALKILTKPASEGITVTGAMIFFTLRLPFGGLPITESQVNSLIVMIALLGLCLYMTHGLKVIPDLKRQHLAEWIVEKCQGMVDENMGPRFSGFAPFVAAIMGLSAFSSLSSLLGLYPATSDVNIVAGWAILVFILITYYKLKGGLGNYLKGFTEPMALLAPINVIGEIATPVSMAFRHYGNVLSGVVVSTLVAAALQGLSSKLLGWLPGILGQIPFLQVGIPAILSLYFDLFSGCLQAFIFALLTMLNVAGGFPEEEYEKRMAKKKAKAMKKAAQAAN